MAAAAYEHRPREWVDERLGLVFSSFGGIVTYFPAAPFYVDGIRYDIHTGSTMHKRPMVEIDLDGRLLEVPILASRPPSDDELDQYVRTGFLDGRRV